MADFKVSKRYASSLLDMAVEKNILDSLSKDMELIFSALEENRQLIRMMENPVIKSEIKTAVIDEIFKNKIGKDSLDFIHFVIEKNREDIFFTIIERFLELKDEYLGIVNVEVKTAFDFTGDQKEQLNTNLVRLLNKKVKLKFMIEKNMIGGFVAKVGDTVYDASVKHQLEVLKKQFLEGTVSLN